MNIRIGNHSIGDDRPCFIIAEAGVNHNGDVARAKQLIDIARSAGADAIKFQTFRAEQTVTQTAPKAEYQMVATDAGESQLGMLKKLELSEEDFTELFSYAGQVGITSFSTPFDKGSVDFLERLGVPAFKVASGEITNLPLLKSIADKKKPVILSTGLATDKEIGEALEILSQAGNPGCILLHCVTAYPARIEDMNLRVMAGLKRTFGVPVGLSDHTPGITVPIAAVALGACVIEKHLTLDKTLPGPDHKASLDPEELKNMVRAIRETEQALGNGIKTLTSEEESNRMVIRRSVVAAAAIPAGTVVKENMFDTKRPGTGMPPGDIPSLVGKRTVRDIAGGEMVTPEMFSGEIHENQIS